jgi:WD40 repeat protein
MSTTQVIGFLLVFGTVAQSVETEAAEPVLFDIGRGTPIRCLAFSPDGTQLAVGDDKGRLDLWTLADQSSKSLAAGGVGFVQFSPDGQRVIAGLPEGMSVWSARDGSGLKTVGTAYDGTYQVAPNGWVSLDGRRAAIDAWVGGPNTTWDFFDLETGQKLASLARKRGGKMRARIAPDGKLGVIPGHEAVQLIDLATGREFPPIQ